MELSEKASKRFQDWIGLDTWHTGHFYDEQRFYIFVQEALQNSAQLDPSELEDLIIKSRTGSFNAKELKRLANTYKERYEIVKDYISAVKNE